VFDVTQYGNDTNAMLQEFWLNLIQSNPKCTVYFHNRAGYDAILSLEALLSLYEYGYTFNPILQDGKLISLTVLLGTKIQSTIKDSIKLIPGPGHLGRVLRLHTYAAAALTTGTSLAKRRKRL
jgi:hypothetical protein